MPTRKQRRRREKDFRHDVRVYEVDEEGNEVPIAELRAQEERAAKPKPKNASKARGRPARVQRAAQPPSWERALKRGGMMGALMVVALYFVQGPAGSAIGVFYALAFVPLTYWLDRTKYRMDLKRSGQVTPAAKKR